MVLHPEQICQPQSGYVKQNYSIKYVSDIMTKAEDKHMNSSLILGLIFLALGIWITIGLVRTAGKLTIKDKFWNASRILFAIAGGLAILSFVTAQGWQDIFRAGTTTYAIVAYFFLRDGIGEKGYASMGSYTPWEDTLFYDYGVEGKKFCLYVNGRNDGETKVKDRLTIVSFDPKDKDKVIAFMKEHNGKKYRRMRKG